MSKEDIKSVKQLTKQSYGENLGEAFTAVTELRELLSSHDVQDSCLNQQADSMCGYIPFDVRYINYNKRGRYLKSAAKSIIRESRAIRSERSANTPQELITAYYGVKQVLADHPRSESVVPALDYRKMLLNGLMSRAGSPVLLARGKNLANRCFGVLLEDPRFEVTSDSSPIDDSGMRLKGNAKLAFSGDYDIEYADWKINDNELLHSFVGSAEINRFIMLSGLTTSSSSMREEILDTFNGMCRLFTPIGYDEYGNADPVMGPIDLSPLC